MAKRSPKSPRQLKAQKSRGRNFNVAEIMFIKANSAMSVEELADALNAKESEIIALREQYGEVPQPPATNKMVFIKENAPNMTVAEMATALETTVEEVNALIQGYNTANASMTKKSFFVGEGRRRGVVVASEAASQLGDVNNGMSGPSPQGFIKPKSSMSDYIFKTRPDTI